MALIHILVLVELAILLNVHLHMVFKLEARIKILVLQADLQLKSVKQLKLSLTKTPIIAVVGEKEMNDKTVTLRYFGKEGQEVKLVAEFVE